MRSTAGGGSRNAEPERVGECPTEVSRSERVDRRGRPRGQKGDGVNNGGELRMNDPNATVPPVSLYGGTSRSFNAVACST